MSPLNAHHWCALERVWNGSKRARSIVLVCLGNAETLLPCAVQWVAGEWLRDICKREGPQGWFLVTAVNDAAERWWHWIPSKCFQHKHVSFWKVPDPGPEAYFLCIMVSKKFHAIRYHCPKPHGFIYVTRAAKFHSHCSEELIDAQNQAG